MMPQTLHYTDSSSMKKMVIPAQKCGKQVQARSHTSKVRVSEAVFMYYLWQQFITLPTFAAKDILIPEE